MNIVQHMSFIENYHSTDTANLETIWSGSRTSAPRCLSCGKVALRSKNKFVTLTPSFF